MTIYLSLGLIIGLVIGWKLGHRKKTFIEEEIEFQRELKL